MSYCRLSYRQAIPTKHNEQAGSDCWSAKVTCSQPELSAFVSLVTHRLVPSLIVFPRLKFVNILHENDRGAVAPELAAEPDYGPSQPANRLRCGFAAKRLREMPAVGRRPKQTNRLAPGVVVDVHLPDIFGDVDGVGVVRLMHGSADSS